MRDGCSNHLVCSDCLLHDFVLKIKVSLKFSLNISETVGWTYLTKESVSELCSAAQTVVCDYVCVHACVSVFSHVYERGYMRFSLVNEFLINLSIFSEQPMVPSTSFL